MTSTNPPQNFLAKTSWTLSKDFKPCSSMLKTKRRKNSTACKTRKSRKRVLIQIMCILT
jgi:hypothetical protein